MKENLHVKLDNPISKRKDILRSAIDATKMLKEYERSKILFVKKHALIDRLSEKMIAIRDLSGRLASNLPLEREKSKKVEFKEIKEIKIIKEKPTTKDKYDIEIEDIENKINNIEI